VSKNSYQIQTAPRKFKLGPLGSLNQVTKGLAKTIRAMADGTLDIQARHPSNAGRFRVNSVIPVMSAARLHLHRKRKSSAYRHRAFLQVTNSNLVGSMTDRSADRCKPRSDEMRRAARPLRLVRSACTVEPYSLS
jgi:hypothetical protein